MSNPSPLDAAARDELARKAERVIADGAEPWIPAAGFYEDGYTDDVAQFLAACSPTRILALLAAAERGAEVATALCTWPAMHETDEELAVFLRHQAGRLRGDTDPVCNCGHTHSGRCDRWVPTLSGGHVCGCGTASDPRSNGTTIGHEPDVLPQGMTFHAGELGDAYVAGAKSGRDHQPTDEQIARACDAYVKHAHLIRLTPTTPKET
jgi:hypothetical protein